MYQAFYGLRDLPFELTPNTKFLYLTQLQREALSILEYGLSAAKPLTLLIGEAGTGKTTLIHAALESPRCRDVRCVCLNNPVLSAAEFVRTLAMRFDLSSAAAESKSVLLDELESLLRRRRSGGETYALIVDEAQSLTPELLEEVRLLANIETPNEKLLPLVLAGQPELSDRLEHTGLRQLKQRVTLRCDLAPFSLSDTAEYIANRLTVAGGVPAKVFTREAIGVVHQHSQGIPRIMNVICDNALVAGMALRRQPVDRQIVLEVCRDLRIQSHPESSPIELATTAADGGTPMADAGTSATSASVSEPLPSRRRFALRSVFRRDSGSSVPHVVNE